MSLDISLLLLVTFVLFTLVISCFSLNKPVTNFREHAIGHKSFPTTAIVATIVASYFPGGLLRTSITEASIGLWPIVHRVTIALLPFLTLSWLAGRMSKFRHDLSMPETMARAYGSSIRLITALFEISNAIIIISLQIRLIADTANLFVSSGKSIPITILITIVLVIYAIFGGIRAISFADIWQSLFFSTLMIMLGWLVFKKTGKSVIDIIDFLAAQKKFGLDAILPSGREITTIFRYLSCIVTPMSPYLVQHIYMCSSPTQARRAFLYAGIFSTAIVLCITLIGLLVFVCFPDIPSAHVWNHFLSNVPPNLKGIACITILSFAMSTVDSRLHVAGIMLAYDIPKSMPVFKQMAQFYQFPVARAAPFTIGLLAVVLAFNFPILKLVRILVWYGRFYVPIVIAPFILGAVGFRTTALVALIGMTMGCISVFFWEKWIVPIVGTNSAHIPCMLMNGLAMITAHYVLRIIRKDKQRHKKLYVT